MQCGRFILRERIGKGGMGEIFLADDPHGGRVAIKRLLPNCAADPRFVAMFLDEARLVSKMRHPNVCEVYEHGNDGSHYFLAMEHVDGPSLSALLARRKRVGLPSPVACRIVAEVASALDYAHHMHDESGAALAVVHRDVSPSNVLIARDGRVKLVDFGLARARTQLQKTQPGLVKGKFGYLAPEQLVGRADPRTDLFALGLCLYEALVGRPLFDQTTAADTVMAVRSFAGPPPLSPLVPEAIDAVLAGLLAPAPEHRFGSAVEARAAILRAVAHANAHELASEVARSLA